MGGGGRSDGMRERRQGRRRDSEEGANSRCKFILILILFIYADGEIKITDFGLSKILEEDAHSIELTTQV